MNARRRLAAIAVLLVATAAPAATEVAPWRWSGVDRVVAVGDVHGAFEELVEVLVAAGVVDSGLSWIAGDDHLVSLGDLTDRGPDSRRVIDLLMRLEREAREAGGRVHVLLGNHEVMNLIGDLRYVSREEYEAFDDEEDPAARRAAFERFRRRGPGAALAEDEARRIFKAAFPPGFFGHRAAFDPGGPYGGWLLGLPALVIVDDVAFVHGGLSMLAARLGVEELNRRLAGEIRDFLAVQRELDRLGALTLFSGYKSQREQVQALLASSALGTTDWAPEASLVGACLAFLRFDETLAAREDGPLWYRGTSLNAPDAERPVVDAALASVGARAVVVGHSVTESRRVQSRLDGKVIRLDTGMFRALYQGRPSALVIEGASLGVLYPPDETVRAPEPERPRPGSLETDEDLEDFLRSAEVAAMREVGGGITKPWKVTLRMDGRELHAVWKTVDVQLKERVRVGDGFEMGFTDRYHYEAAAYRLDRLLGMRMVPVTVLRTIDGREGSLQLWVEEALNEKARAARDLRPDDPGALDRQKNLMRLFDALVYNVDRNDTNLLYTPADGRLHLIDHSRAFRLRRGLPEETREHPPEVPEEIAERLRALDLATLRSATDGLLSKEQVKSVLARRDQLLKAAASGSRPRSTSRS